MQVEESQENGNLPGGYHKYNVPRDEEDGRYVKCFGVDQKEEIIAFFKEFGFVVARDVLSPQECEDTLSLLFGILEEGSAFRRDDMSTWSSWPKSGMAKHGMPTRKPIFGKAAINNRQNPNVHKVYSYLFGTEDLFINHDRMGMLRPTVGKNCEEKWRTAGGLHLDMNPWSYLSDSDTVVQRNLAKLTYEVPNRLNHFIFENNQVHKNMFNGLHIQGVLNICDNYEEDGGFHCCPGFVHHFEQWAEELRNSKTESEAWKRNSVVFEPSHPFWNYALRIPMRAGSMVVWDQRTPHGGNANYSDRMRVAQFIKMYPKDAMNLHQRDRRCKSLHQIFSQNGFENDITEHGYEVFDLNFDLNAHLGKSNNKPPKRQRNQRI
eukprot:CAMPEP_0174258398 /NCGR_PEP_ID=MMETSP0439-20130205/7392_1 /TAXON_ID=0 /ORGANISM="Stereomyxa ramosa, Strain Chinc5" /LENGTH=376 /DNA_ID=CAMNT_0015341883 /DNA_START=92 /DNA_END=1222 /DNA_ORIENTATION=-